MKLSVKEISMTWNDGKLGKSIAIRNVVICFSLNFFVISNDVIKQGLSNLSLTRNITIFVLKSEFE